MSEQAELNDDFVDLLAALTDEGVDFLVVGAHALAVHGIVRATGDLDVLAARGQSPQDASLGPSFVDETYSTLGTAVFRLRASDGQSKARRRADFIHGLRASERRQRRAGRRRRERL